MPNGRNSRLELTWIGKDNRPRLEPRILLPDPGKSYHAKHRVSDQDLFDNRLIFGDNLLALKALEAEFAGKIKCIYIDPPYNTGSAFTHYDDGIEHSVWLSMMRDRLEILRRLLAVNGVIFVQIDDNEHAYLKVLMDETFGRANFVSTIVWQKKYAGKPDSRFFSEFHEYIVCYAKEIEKATINGMPRTQAQDSRYKNADNDPRGVWASDNLLRTEVRDYAVYPLKTPSGRVYLPPKGNSWRFTKERMAELVADNRIWFGESGGNMPRLKRFLDDVATSLPPSTWWPHTEVGNTGEAKKEILGLFPEVEQVFATPKPERLMQRVLALGSNPGDWVMDSFAGSGTTGAVAHKMGRRWIMVELGEHCHTHIIPRLKKVIDGADPAGVTEATGWKGGGGFRYSTLAPSLLQKDKFGNWVINKKYNPSMLAEAICKLAGFRYAPSDSVYWQHGQSSETDFIYVTTRSMTRNMLAKLSEEVGEKRTLMVYCTAFRVKANAFPNLTLKKIPKAVLSKCEWGKDDYSLEIKNLPQAPPSADETAPPTRAAGGRRGRKDQSTQPTLFEQGARS